MLMMKQFHSPGTMLSGLAGKSLLRCPFLESFCGLGKMFRSPPLVLWQISSILA